MSVTHPSGFRAGGAACGIKAGVVPDLAVVTAAEAVPAAAVFTRNTAAAAPVVLSRRHVAGGTARAVVINSGCANAATGAAGMSAALAMADATARRLGCDPTDVLVCSTGTIGDQIPLDRVTNGIAEFELSDDGGAAAARAILTTDSRPKQAVVIGDGFSVGSMAKGAGMVRPDMATMLAVVTTDAIADPYTLDTVLRRAVVRSFNALNIDGCESTNDTVIVMASGASGVEADLSDLAAAVEEACRSLAYQMAADAEGASRVVIIELGGAWDDETALRLARAVADSALVRASFYGADPNWGRLLAAMGSTRIPFDPNAVSVAYAGAEVAHAGMATDADLDAVAEKLAGDLIVSITVGDGPGRCSLLTTDLTPDYVRFNADRS
ncbi:MAG TPA: bifunctional glutamate N-acetyltransferase/amino-acid acetyltransferase ArgJ [Acidimicrobiia bacterium]|nr:bifunctional glutamate N-acetyltransferase/amino-acid acetyltransferase ArgJ [Acidimicrobiia bacterium]